MTLKSCYWLIKKKKEKIPFDDQSIIVFCWRFKCISHEYVHKQPCTI